jgi:hypothetical protein
MDEFSGSPSSDAAFNLDCMSAEEKLRASEERYHSLFSNMMDGFAFCKMIFDQENNPIDFVYIEIEVAVDHCGLTPRLRLKPPNPTLLPAPP